MNDVVAEKPVVLIVDDSKVIRLGARKMLSDTYNVLLAEDGEIGWKVLQENPEVLVVFTDLNMPNINGMELLGRIRGCDDESTAKLPVIILSGAEDESQEKNEAMQAGATDFIFKPFDSAEINSRVRSYVNFSRKLKNLEKNTTYDKTTGLINIDAFCEYGEKAVSASHRHHTEMSVCVFEINKLKQYSSTYGKKVAEIILQTVVKRLKKVLREEDIATRVNASLFALLLSASDKDRATVALERLQQDIQKLVFDVGTEKIKLSINIGYTSMSPGLSQNKGVTFEQLMDQAKQAFGHLQDTLSGGLAYYGDTCNLEGTGVIIDESMDPRSEDGLLQALQCIVQGEFEKISIHDRQCVADQLSLFMRFAEKHQT